MTKRALAIGFVLGMGGTLTGCGPSDPVDEYVALCAPDVSEEICRCMGLEARSRMSPKAWEVLLLETQDKGQEAQAIKDTMSPEEFKAMMTINEDTGRHCIAKIP